MTSGLFFTLCAKALKSAFDVESKIFHFPHFVANEQSTNAFITLKRLACFSRNPLPPTLGAASAQRLVTNAVCPFRVDQQTATQNCMRNSSEPNSRARGSGVTMTSAAMTPPTIPMSQGVTATGRHPVRRKDLGNSIWLAPQHQTLETHRGPSSPRACGALHDLLSTAEAAAERPPQPTRPAKATPSHGRTFRE